MARKATAKKIGGGAPIILLTSPRGASRAASRRSNGGGGRRRRQRRPKPTAGQIARGATGALLLGVPLGLAGAVGGLALDAGLAKKRLWQPPVIGWRGVFGLGLFTVGAVTRSPVVLVAGTMLFATSLPAATNALASAMAGSPVQLPGISGQRIAGLPGALRRGLRAMLSDEEEEDSAGVEDLEEGSAGLEDLKDAVVDRVADRVADLIEDPSHG